MEPCGMPALMDFRLEVQHSGSDLISSQSTSLPAKPRA